ncbi:transposase [Streptomyces pratensis]|uniref:transposase n=1 Tax=Streptomyces pratensis TaxID=1169025 RepID=UPI0037BA701C
MNGRKRHVVVDTLDLPLAVMVTAADVGDRGAAQVLLTQVTAAHHLLALVWADDGYQGLQTVQSARHTTDKRFEEAPTANLGPRSMFNSAA